MSGQEEFWFTLLVSLCLYALPEEFYFMLWKFTKFALFGLGAGAASIVTVVLLRRFRETYVRTDISASNIVSFYKSKKKEVEVTWPDDWCASNTKVIYYEIEESELISCNIRREGEDISSTITWHEGKLEVIFAAALAGEYKISVQYDGWEVRNSPWVRYINPGPPDPKQSEVTGPWANSSTIVVQPGEVTQSFLTLRDSYKNLIHTSRSDCQDVTIQISNGCATVPEGEPSVECCNTEIKLSAKFYRDWSFNISVFYKGHLMCSVQAISCKSLDYVQVLEKSSQVELIQLLGDHLSKPKQVHIFLSNKYITIKEYVMRVIPWTLLSHRISNRLHLTLNSKCNQLELMNENAPNCKTVISGDNILALAAGYYTCLEKRLGSSNTLQEKQDHFSKLVLDNFNNSYMQQFFGGILSMRNSRVYIKVNRQNIYESTLKSIKSLSKTDWYKLIVVKFEGEDGIDQGGLRREWMDLFSKYVFNPENKIFTCIEAGGSGVQPNPYPEKSVKIDHYRLIGKLVSKCLLEMCFGKTYRMNLQGQMSSSMLTQMLGADVTYSHLSDDAPQLYTSKIKYILDNDVEDLQLTFTQEEEVSGGVIKSIDLCSKGSTKLVTEQNKQQYIYTLAKFLLVDRVSKQMEAFLEGFHSLIPCDILDMFDEKELELLLHGIREYNVQELKLNHTLVGYKSPRFGQVLDWFWMALTHFSKEDMAKFVQFVTGSSVLPPGGWKQLAPNFQIGFSGEKGRLPLSFTCSNYILLPNASNYQEFEKVLLMAVREGVDRFIMGS